MCLLSRPVLAYKHLGLQKLPETRNDLVNSGRVSAHHVLPQSGWISYWIKGEEDIPAVIELFKMRYDSLKPKANLVSV
jgi:luciferase-like monooxygenase